MENPSDRSAQADSYGTFPLIRRLILLSWRYRADCLRIIALQLVLLFFSLSALNFLGLGIDTLHHHLKPERSAPVWPLHLRVTEGLSTGESIVVIAALMLVFALCRIALNYVFQMQVARLVNEKIVVDLRVKVYDKLQRLSFRFFDANSSGSLINRVTGDVQNVRLFVDGVLIQVFIIAISVAVYLVFMFRIHPQLALVCLASSPVILFASILFSRFIKPYYARNRELVDVMVSRIAEGIQGMSVTKAFSLERMQNEKFAQSVGRVRDQQRSIFWRTSFFAPSMDFLTQFNIFLLILYGGYLVIQGELPLGTGLIVFSGLLQQFAAQVSAIVTVTNSIQQSLIGARRVFEVLDRESEIRSPEVTRFPLRREGSIVFESVSFAYEPGEPVLKNISVEIRAGERVGILGVTGSGKSTLLSLLGRFYDPNSGAISIDGVPIKNRDLADLRRQIGVVFQENFLFSNSVTANISFGHPEAGLDAVVRAAKIAKAHDFVNALPSGYSTILGEGGNGLSGGQRQRLALARAVLLEPSILLLDDPTAAVDPETEHEILDAMEGAMTGRTTLLVAHRIGTLKRCDRILVIEGGRLTHFGTHTELLSQPGFYRDVALIQNAVRDE